MKQEAVSFMGRLSLSLSLPLLEDEGCGKVKLLAEFRIVASTWSFTFSPLYTSMA